MLLLLSPYISMHPISDLYLEKYKVACMSDAVNNNSWTFKCSRISRSYVVHFDKDFLQNMILKWGNIRKKFGVQKPWYWKCNLARSKLFAQYVSAKTFRQTWQWAFQYNLTTYVILVYLLPFDHSDCRHAVRIPTRTDLDFWCISWSCKTSWNNHGNRYGILITFRKYE